MWVGCGSRVLGVPPYDSLNLYGVFNSRFYPSVSQKRLELKSLKRQTKAEEEGTPLKSLKMQTKAEEEETPGPFLLSLRLSLKTL